MNTRCAEREKAFNLKLTWSAMVVRPTYVQRVPNSTPAKVHAMRYYAISVYVIVSKPKVVTFKSLQSEYFLAIIEETTINKDLKRKTQ